MSIKIKESKAGIHVHRYAGVDSSGKALSTKIGTMAVPNYMTSHNGVEGSMIGKIPPDLLENMTPVEVRLLDEYLQDQGSKVVLDYLVGLPHKLSGAATCIGLAKLNETLAQRLLQANADFSAAMKKAGHRRLTKSSGKSEDIQLAGEAECVPPSVDVLGQPDDAI